VMLLGSLFLRMGCAQSEAEMEAMANFDKETCPHRADQNSYTEFLTKPTTEPGSYTDVHAMWSTHVEVIHITNDNPGGWEPPSFSKNLAVESIKGWERFRDDIVPKLPNGHKLKNMLPDPLDLNSAFFQYQKSLFEKEGNLHEALHGDDTPNTPPPSAPSSWPEMDQLPEYKKLRKIVETVSPRYLTRSGMDPRRAANLSYSIFNWVAVNTAGEFHGPHMHTGEHHVAVFYAQAGPGAGKLIFGDPRGHSPPFGKEWVITPKAGDLIVFPAWLKHTATVTGVNDLEGMDKHRVIFAFNIGPRSGPYSCHQWWSDPTSDMRFHRRSKIDVEAFSDRRVLGV